MIADSAASVLVSGLLTGSLYALMAIGLSLVWSTLGIFNFVHGAFMALAAYLAWQITDGAGAGVATATAVTFVVTILVGLGCIVERTLVRPFLGRDNLLQITVITTLAGLTFIENGIQMSWGPEPRRLDPVMAGEVHVAGVPVSASQALTVILAPLLLVGLWWFLGRTRIGSAIRAVGQNRDAALLMGLPVERLYLAAFGASAGLAAMAGILLASTQGLTPTLGTDLIVKAMVVAIFGGLGTLVGSAGGAYVVGMLEAVSQHAVGAQWAPVVVFSVIIVVLLWRPTGLFGRQ